MSSISIPKTDKATRIALQKLSARLKYDSSPTFDGITLTGLDASEFVFTNASKSLVSINVPLTVNYGGSGAATFTDHSILLGSGTDAFTALGAATNGQIPIGSTGLDPVLATLTQGTGIAVTNGAGSITVAVDATLDEIGNLAANKTFNNGAFSVSFNFTNPTNQPTYDGAFEIQASGAFAGDLFHVHQHTGNPGTTDLCHFEADDADVTVLRLQHDVSGANCLEVGASGAIKLRITDDGGLFVLERAADLADVAGFGQLWVRNDTPNNLCFTDDTGVIYELSHNLTTDIDHDALTNFVADEHVAHSTMTVAIANGGTGQTTAQAAIDALSAVAAATNEHVLTKDTATGNAIWKAAAGGGNAFGTITGITNDVVADAASDTLTLSSANAKLTIVGTAATDTITFAVVEGQIDHNALTNYSANKHIDHTAVTLTAGTGMSGGGDISANRTFNCTGLLGDGTAGRVFRIAQLTIANGTNANTVKCTLASIWNGDVIAVTDNIAKNATTGNYYLSLGGTDLRILGTGITGDPLTAFNNLAYNDTGTGIFTTSKYEATPAIEVNARNATTGTAIDWTALVDGGGGTVVLFILYLTTA